jgi:tRNA(Ile)-lysidine synthase
LRADIPLHPLGRRIRRTLRRHGLVAAGDRVAAAVSGGSDSVALACLLHALASTWTLAGLIHVNHGLRGRASDADERLVRDLAASLGVPVAVRHADVAAAAASRRRSVESVARDLRYGAFESAAAELGANLVATGHTRDDQAETVLLRLFRGAGSRGVAAVRFKRGRYVRPLLDCRRADLRAYLDARDQPFLDDASNADTRIPRNHIRHVILPGITAAWPGAVAALARFAEMAAEDEAFLARTAAEVTPAMTLPAVDGVQQLDVRGLRQLPAPLARRVVRGAIETAGGVASFRDVEAVLQLARTDKEGRKERHLDLQGSRVDRDGPMLTFVAHTAAGPVDAARSGFSYALPIPGEVALPETGTTIRASLITGAIERPAGTDGVSMAAVQADRLAGPLTVRSRQPGDRFRPFGAPGSRKLQDLLVDRKVPRAGRDRVPLIVDREGRIVWVVGLAIADDMRVRAPERGMVVLESTKGNQ